MYQGASKMSICNKAGRYADGKGVNCGRVVLHSDLNNFFASVECAQNPELRPFAVAVCGDTSKRHGIILAKNEKAKLYGIKTGEPLFEAFKKCPNLKTVQAHYDLYMRYSRAARRIYLRYTDKVEPFGMDEAWLELTGCHGVKTIDDGKRIADEIRRTMKEELGVSVSIGVSDNKVFAKLASDYKKPDATTVMSPREYDGLICSLPIGEILYVGASTEARLKRFGLTTIGQVANANPYTLRSILGKNGLTLHDFCTGFDTSPVARFGEVPTVKSVSNSTTPPRDISSNEDAKLVLASLCDNVCARLRGEGLKCTTVQVFFRTTDLNSFERQIKTDFPTSCQKDLLSLSYGLFCKSIDVGQTPLRSVGVCATGLVSDMAGGQLSLFEEDNRETKNDIIDKTVDIIRKRYGMKSISTGTILCDSESLGYLAHGYEVFTHLR